MEHDERADAPVETGGAEQASGPVKRPVPYRGAASLRDRSSGAPEEPARAGPPTVTTEVPGGSEEDDVVSAETVYFPPEVARFLTELARAIQKHTMYPPAHPALRPAVARVWRELRTLMERRGVVILGVGRGQIAFEDAETDPDHPIFRSLAGHLHRHEIAGVAFHAGLREPELDEFLSTASRDPKRSTRPLGRLVEEEGSPWPHVELSPARYERLGLAWEGRPQVQSHGGTEEPEDDGVWLDLARGLLVGGGGAGASAGAGSAPEREPDGADDDPGPGSGGSAEEEVAPEDLARAVAARARDAAYSRAAFQRFAGFSHELRRRGGVSGGQALGRRASAFVTSLAPEDLHLVLGAASQGERHQLVEDASRWMEPSALVLLVQATGTVERRQLPHTLLMLMAKLARYAGSEAPDLRAEAESNLRAQVEQLVSGWNAQDAVPEGYREALERMAFTAPERTDVQDPGKGVEPERVLRVGLFVNKVGPHVWMAVSALVQAREFRTLLDTLDGAPLGSAAAEELWDSIAQPKAVAWVLSAKTPDFQVLDRLVSRLGTAAAAPMLDALAATDSREVRNGLFTRLAEMGPGITPQVVERLRHPSPAARRSMLALLGQLGGWPADWSPFPFTRDRHPAVRREALKLLLRVRSHRDQAICELLADEDPRAIALGLAAAQREAPPEALVHLVELAEREDLEPELRTLAIRGAAPYRPAELFPMLMQLASEPRRGPFRLFRRRRPRKEKTPLSLEALAALARGWPSEPAAERLLARARVSEDRELRAAGAGRILR